MAIIERSSTEFIKPLSNCNYTSAQIFQKITVTFISLLGVEEQDSSFKKVGYRMYTKLKQILQDFFDDRIIFET
jgi:hypothetical protein